MMGDAESFGAWLRRRRRSLDLTQQELAARVGCSTVSIRKFESSAQRPSRQLAERLALHLLIPPDEQVAFVQFARSGLASQPATQLLVDAPLPSEVAPPLVQQPTPTVGREREVAELSALLLREDVRLLTITGPPGVGKTHLSLALAAVLHDQFADGITVVPLAAYHDPQQLVVAIALGLGLTEASNGAWYTIVRMLQQRQQLLVLDNFEHLLAAVPLLQQLLMAAPTLRVLVTSQTPLQLAGEQEYPLAPLALPPLLTSRCDPAAYYETVAESAAVQLFVARAQAVLPSFALTPENASAVAAVCAQLDGLPLAIELAAARSRMLSPAALRDELAASGNLALLTIGRRDAPARHQTLRAAIRWSYDLLTPPEQALFRRLSTLVGGGALELVRALGADLSAQPGEPAVLDLLHALVQKSLVRVEALPEGNERLVLLEALRAFAHEQLVAQAELADARRAHAHAVQTFAAHAAPHVERGELAWLRRVDAETANIEAAVQWSFGPEGERALGLSLLGTLHWTITTRMLTRQGSPMIGPVAAQLTVQEPPPLRALQLRALLATLGLLVFSGQAVPTDLLQSLDAYWGAQSERTEHGYVQLYTALAHAADAPLSVADRTALLGRALAQFRKAGSLTGQATTLFWQSHLLLAQGDLPQAQLAAEAMHALVERVGDPLGRSWAQMALGQVALAHGQMEEAAELLEAALAGFQQLGQEIGELTLLQTLSRLAVQRGQLQQAYELLSRSVQLAQMRDDAPMLYKCAIVLAGILVADTKPLAALELLGAVSVVGETGVPVAWEFRGVYEQLVSVAREGADPEAAAAAWRAGGEAHVADVIVKHLAPAASPLV